MTVIWRRRNEICMFEIVLHLNMNKFRQFKKVDMLTPMRTILDVLINDVRPGDHVWLCTTVLSEIAYGNIY